MTKNRHNLIKASLFSMRSYLPTNLLTLLINITIVFLLISISNNSWALKTDTEQPMYIDADKQQIDMKTNTVTFTGNVKFVQGSIKINANKAVIVRPNNQVGMEIVYTYGAPATFEQQLDDGSMINGDSLRMKYVAQSEFLYMYEKAHLLHNCNHVYGDTITYDIQKEFLNANRNEQSRVKTIINNTNENSSESIDKDQCLNQKENK